MGKTLFVLLMVAGAIVAAPAVAQNSAGGEETEDDGSADAAVKQVAVRLDARARVLPRKRRFMRHSFLPDRQPTSDTPLWLVTADDEVPQQIEAELHMLSEMHDAINRISTINKEAIRIRILMPRPAVGITIPIP